ncbi:MAG TPA: pectate lyase [Gammaproteobacteria bacterium]|nr:pectate lyase [Gammaproteobacteria bacterium]
MKATWYALKDRLPSRRTVTDADVHLAAAADWLARAQDATPDDGVAAWYDLEEQSWKASYPETTGYIIPTFYDYAACSGRPEFAERARRMAAWEVDIQLAEGGVRAGTIDGSTVAPTIFNTGQVLFGWARAWKETGDIRFRQALVRAADWLVAAQDADGAWRRFASPVARHALNSYNTRTAWGLACAGNTLDDDRYRDAARANVEWCVSRAHANAWLDDNCLNLNDRPLVHTIAYSIRGILEVGAILGADGFVQFATRMARAVAAAQRRDGALPGRLDGQWRPTVGWSCLTGNSQMAINWLRLVQLGGDAVFRDFALRANRFNMETQDVTNGNPGMCGGIKGSFPIDGGYMTCRYPNWAAKFFMDALMLERQS